MGKVITFKTNLMHKGPETWSVQKSAKTWFFKKDESAMGAIGDLGIHKADLIRWLLDDEISEVTALVDTLDKKDAEGNLIGVDDNAICILRTKTGTVGTLTASWTNYAQEDNSTILYCEKGVVKIYTTPEHPLLIAYKDGTCESIPVRAIQTNDNQTKSGIIDSFVDSIERGVKPEIPGEEGLAALEIIFACFESAYKGTKITIGKRDNE
jgi:predicted dehydrogenase